MIITTPYGTNLERYADIFNLTAGESDQLFRANSENSCFDPQRGLLDPTWVARLAPRVARALGQAFFDVAGRVDSDAEALLASHNAFSLVRHARREELDAATPL
jgi:hypothetical protein